MNVCKHCKKLYSNSTDYCSRLCHIKAIAQRTKDARGLIHQPGYAMQDREFLVDLLGPRMDHPLKAGVG